MNKLYCYVDESGQDTTAQSEREQLFVVAIVITAQNRDEIESLCKKYEQLSGKQSKKWNKVRFHQRLKYFEYIVHDRAFKNSMYYSVTQHLTKPDYDAITISSIVRFLNENQPANQYEADLFIDGISHSKQREYSLNLRRLGAKVSRVHRARDESYPLVRLADSLAGLVRSALKNDIQALKLLKLALKNRAVHEG